MEVKELEHFIYQKASMEPFLKHSVIGLDEIREKIDDLNEKFVSTQDMEIHVVLPKCWLYGVPVVFETEA